MEKKTGCRRRIVIKEDFIFVGVCGHVTGAWWAPWGPGLSIFRFRRPWRCFLPVETCLEFNSKLGVVIYGHRPSQPGFQAGVEWADDPQPWRHVPRVGSGQYGTYNQRWANKGQRTSQLSPPRTTYFLFWLVGFQTTAKGWLGYEIEHKKTFQPYESGIDGAILQWLARVVLPRVLRFPPTKKDLIQKENKRKREFHFIFNFL